MLPLKPRIKVAPLEVAMDLTKTLNTAFVSTQLGVIDASLSAGGDPELQRLMGTPAFRAILSAVRELAVTENLDEQEAAERIVTTVRRLDQLWREYLIREGLERLRS